MGLDMSVYKYNKKYSEEEFNNVRIAQKYDYNKIDLIKEKIDDYKNLSEEDYIRKYMNECYVREIYPPQGVIDRVKKRYPDNYKEILKESHEATLNSARKHIREEIEQLESFIKLSKEFVEKAEELDPIEIAYWRKHSDLNGYMEELYREKGGTKEFNCVALYLSKKDIENIIRDHKRHLNRDDDFTIGESSGFFWGSTEEEDWKNSLNDFEEILENTDWDNETVYYHCWW